LEHSLRSPLLWMSESQYFSPFVKIRNYFESFGYFSASVSGKNPTNFSINSSDFRIIN